MPRSNSYTKYHSDLKRAVALGHAPTAVLAQIPRSTRSSFKNSDYSSLFGTEFSGSLADDLDTVKAWAQDRSALAVYRAVNRVKTVLIAWMAMVRSGAADLRAIKKRIVATILMVKDTLGFDRALRYFKISASTFYLWLSSISHQCTDSVRAACFRIWPSQLTKKEVALMKRYFTDPRYAGWPVASIAAIALRNGDLTAHVSTWRKYAHLLDIFRRKPKHRRKKHEIGIRADAPNKMWHADVTAFRTQDNVKAYIYLVTDNFSRMILAWRVSLTLSANIAFDNIKEAYTKYCEGKPHKVTLMVDGGHENHGQPIEEFLARPEVSIEKIRAQVDIRFSNSMVESSNRVLKYQSLYQKDIRDVNHLERHLNEYIPNYNEVRPHSAHGYLTPKEVFEGQRPDWSKFKDQIQQVKTARIAENQGYSCGKC